MNAQGTTQYPTDPQRYGASLRKQVKKMEISQHAKYTCTFCGKVRPILHPDYSLLKLMPYQFLKDTVKRTAVGIWNCGACRKVIAGGAWTVSTTTAATVRRFVFDLCVHLQGFWLTDLALFSTAPFVVFARSPRPRCTSSFITLMLPCSYVRPKLQSINPIH